MFGLSGLSVLKPAAFVNIVVFIFNFCRLILKEKDPVDELLAVRLLALDQDLSMLE